MKDIVSDTGNKVDRWGNLLMRRMQRCIAWPSVLLPFKVLLIGSGLLALKWTALRRFRPQLTTKQGLLLEGAPLDSTLNTIVFYRGEFEPVLTQWLPHWIEPGDVCVDAGANVGYFTLLMARCVGRTGKVFSVEAAPRNVLRIERNLQINQFAQTHSDVVQVIHAACAPQSGQITFYLNRHNDMHCRLQPPRPQELDFWLMGGTHAWKPVTVNASNFKLILGDHAGAVSFIKLDIEGAEHLMVEEILQLCTHPRLKVALEVKTPHVRASLVGFERAGFHLYDLRNNYRWLFSHKLLQFRRLDFEKAYQATYMLDVLVSRQPLKEVH